MDKGRGGVRGGKGRRWCRGRPDIRTARAQQEDDGGGDNGDEARWRLHVDIFTYLVAQHCYAGAVTSIGPDYEAVALW